MILLNPPPSGDHIYLAMNLSNKLTRIKKVKQRLQNVNIIFLLQNLNDDCLLNGKQIFFIMLHLKK